MATLLFIIGFAIGYVLFNIAYYMWLDRKDQKEFKKFVKWYKDPSTEEFLYNDEGEKIWSNKKGCIGPATYIKR